MKTKILSVLCILCVSLANAAQTPRAVVPRVAVLSTLSPTVNTAELLEHLEYERGQWSARAIQFAPYPEALAYCRSRVDQLNELIAFVKALATMPAPTPAQTPPLASRGFAR